MRAFPANILQDKRIGNCSNHGISDRYDQVYILHPDGWISLNEENLPANTVIVKTKKFGNSDYTYAEPEEDTWDGHIGWMMGGCFIYSCDSRFHRVFGDYPIPLHDRQESADVYDMLSR